MEAVVPDYKLKWHKVQTTAFFELMHELYPNPDGEIDFDWAYVFREACYSSHYSKDTYESNC